MHTGHHIWKSKAGETLHLHVITVPLMLENEKFDQVMELAVDITQTFKLEEGLRFAHGFLENVVKTSMDGIVAVDNSGNVPILNPAAYNLFDLDTKQRIRKEHLEKLMPPGFFKRILEGSGHVYLPETEIHTPSSESRPARLVGNQLIVGDKPFGLAVFIQDLRKLKTLEKEKLEAERMAAVGQTVAGLAHGVKNLITSLEGGMYMLKSGLQKGDVERLGKGLDMLVRNTDRISLFVRSFLSFARGREIRAKMNDPQEPAREVVEAHLLKAAEIGIELKLETVGPIQTAPIDYESIHEALTNLVSNAIDACRVSEKEIHCHVIVRVFESNDALVYEVIDNGCGMDYEVKKKVFTTFFTTKGLGGTGLGLLMTKKIVQEHGGKVEMETEIGRGTTFRILLHRKRLPNPVN
jgi:signal transduction histidine kinase